MSVMGPQIEAAAASASAAASSSTLVTQGHRKGHRRQESFYEMTGLYAEVRADDSSADLPMDSDSPPGTQAHLPRVADDTVIKCHSRQPSSGLVAEKQLPETDDEEDLSRDCGILSFRPQKIQKLARIKV